MSKQIESIRRRMKAIITQSQNIENIALAQAVCDLLDEVAFYQKDVEVHKTCKYNHDGPAGW